MQEVTPEMFEQPKGPPPPPPPKPYSGPKPRFLFGPEARIVYFVVGIGIILYAVYMFMHL